MEVDEPPACAGGGIDLFRLHGQVMSIRRISGMPAEDLRCKPVPAPLCSTGKGETSVLLITRTARGIVRERRQKGLVASEQLVARVMY